MSDKPSIVVQNLYKVFGRRAKRGVQLLEEGLDKQQLLEKTGMSVGVQNVSFEIPPGEIFVVMGLSGSGKSTLLRMLNRLIEPTAGRVLMRGRDVAELSHKELIELRRHQMAMVFQTFALMPHLNVRDNVALGLKMAGVSKAERYHRAEEMLERVGLREYADSAPRELSGGMQQRVGLARALAVDPEVMLMDEAFSALDPLIRAEMQDQLLELQQDNPRTVVFISHDLDEAIKIGDRIAIMDSGQVVQVGTADEILSAPANDFVRSFFAGVNPKDVYRARDVVRRDPLTLVDRHEDGVRVALQRLRDHQRGYGYVRDLHGKFLGVTSVDRLLEQLHRRQKDLKQALIDVTPLDPDTELDEVIRRVRRSPCPVPVVGDSGRLEGIVSKTAILEAMQAARASEEPAGESESAAAESSRTGNESTEEKAS